MWGVSGGIFALVRTSGVDLGVSGVDAVRRNVRAQHDGSPAPHDEMCVLTLFSCLFVFILQEKTKTGSAGKNDN